ADFAATLQNHDIVNAVLAQANGTAQAGKTGADDQCVRHLAGGAGGIHFFNPAGGGGFFVQGFYVFHDSYTQYVCTGTALSGVVSVFTSIKHRATSSGSRAGDMNILTQPSIAGL